MAQRASSGSLGLMQGLTYVPTLKVLGLSLSIGSPQELPSVSRMVSEYRIQEAPRFRALFSL